MEALQSFSHPYLFKNLSFSTSIIDFFRFLTSTMVLLPSKAICEPSVANTSVYLSSLLRHILSQTCKNFLPSSKPTSYKGPRLVPLGKSFPWLGRPPSWSHTLLSSVESSFQGLFLILLGMPCILLCCLSMKIPS